MGDYQTIAKMLADKEAEIERLTKQCEGLYQSAMNNGQELLLRERAMEEAAVFLDGLATNLLTGEDWEVEELAPDCRAMAKKLRALEGK